MDKKDEIILQQLEVIRSMTEQSIKGMGNDFFGKGTVELDKSSPFYVDRAKEKRREELRKELSADLERIEKNENAKEQPKEAVPCSAPEEPQEPETPAESIEDLKAELNGYVGLNSIKKEVGNLINMVQIHKMRQANDLPVTDLSLHMVFSGNPGTGKSTVARIMARIYKSLGILSKGQLIEVDRAGLVAGYVGQTAIKTAEVIEKAKGGLLFIDEAYALSNKSENDFGQEAIDTILKAMEDNRDDLVIIVAGYDKLMDDFIHSNPGLESRFNRYLHFDDYTIDEMVAIFEMYCKKGYYELAEGTKDAVRAFIQTENTNSISFGNARGVRNIFEHILVCQANRLAARACTDAPEGQSAVTREDLMRITPEDVEAARKDAEEGWSPAARKATDRGGSGTKDATPTEELQSLLEALNDSSVTQ